MKAFSLSPSLVAVVTLVFVPSLYSQQRPPALPEVGREMKPLEESVREPRVPRKPAETKKDAIADELKKQADDTEPAPDVEGKGVIRSVVFEGDVAWLELQGAASDIRNAVVGRGTDKMDEVREFVDEVQQRLVNDQYYLASLWVREFREDEGELVITVDAGRVGGLKMFFTSTEAADGKYYSGSQIRRRMFRTRTGQVFKYDLLLRDAYDVNTHPDLTVDTDLNVESFVEDDLLKRRINMDFTVEERLPLHGVVSLNNYGTEATGDWQGAVTLQHLNLTRRDDVLTLSAPFSLDFESLLTLGGSYSIPYFGEHGGRFTTYGGYSELDSREVVESVDVVGTGWFAGLQWSHNLINSDRHLLAGSVGVVHRFIEDQLVVQSFSTEPREATVVPFSAALSYTGIEADRFGGRNFGTLQAIANFGGVLGASEDEEVQTLRPAAEADYMIARIQAARIQPVFGRPGEDGRMTNRWVFFTKLEGQAADGPVIPAEQLGVGGARTVRGYLEREFFGDDGVYANLELRTPMIFGLFTGILPLPEPREGEFPEDTLQGVLFLDGGYTRIQDPLPSEEDSETLLSAGVGVRISLTNRVQIRADWGFPFEETDETSTSGRGHLEIQVQF